MVNDLISGSFIYSGQKTIDCGAFGVRYILSSKR